MNIIWKNVHKPLVWGPLFVLSVLAFNVFMGHTIGIIAVYTFFSIIFAVCMANPSGQTYIRKESHFKDAHVQQKSYSQEASDRRLINYGSRANYSMYDSDRMFRR